MWRPPLEQRGLVGSDVVAGESSRIILKADNDHMYTAGAGSLAIASCVFEVLSVSTCQPCHGHGAFSDIQFLDPEPLGALRSNYRPEIIYANISVQDILHRATLDDGENHKLGRADASARLRRAIFSV